MSPTPMNPDCDLWNDSTSWNATVKQGLMNFALASMDALIYPFFWTWKVGCVLKRFLGGEAWSAVFILAPVGHRRPCSHIGLSTSVGPIFLCHTSGPENNPYLYFSPSPCHLASLSFIILLYWSLVVEWGPGSLLR
jgi:hypothetical protein